MKKMIYLLSNHARFELEPDLNPKFMVSGLEDDFGISFQIDEGELYETSMIKSIDTLKQVLSEATYILTFGNLDVTGIFELGMASALGKKVYFLNLTHQEITLEDLRLDYVDLDLEFINWEELTVLIEKLK